MRFLLALVLWLAAFGVPSVDPSTTSASQVTPTPARTTPGLTLRAYQLEHAPTAIPTLAPSQTPNIDALVPTVDFRMVDGRPTLVPALPGPIYVELIGWLALDAPRTVVFELTSDDGARLLLDGQITIDHDGRHGATAKQSAPVTLAAGSHPIRIEYFDAGGARRLTLAWHESTAAASNAPFAPVPTTLSGARFHAEADPTRVTSPGPKRVLDGNRPGDRAPLAALHPAFERFAACPPTLTPKVGAMAMLPNGHLVIGTFDPLQRDEERLPDITAKKPDVLLAIEGWDALDPTSITAREIAHGLYEPCGLAVIDGDLYVSQRTAITQLSDRDGDGFYETHRTVASGWEGWNYHQFTFGLVHVPPPPGVQGRGHLYAALSTAMAPPAWEGMGTNAAPNGPFRGGILEVDLDSDDWRIIAGGTRTPDGIGRGPQGTIVYCDNQGTWFPASTLSVIEPGRFYGHYNNTNVVPKLNERFPQGGRASVFCDRVVTPPTVYFPQNECGNSPTQPILVESGLWAGQLLVGDVTAGGLHRVELERVDGQWQGAVFHCSQGLSCGVHRLAWGPNGDLVVGGIGAQGNWNWKGTQFGLERLRPTGKSAFELSSMRVTEDGFTLRFTKPIDAAWLADPTNYRLRSWRYTPTAAYGGPKVDDRTLLVKRAIPNAAGDEVRIVVDGLALGTCVWLWIDPRSIDGETLWSTEAWYTLHRTRRASASGEDSSASDGATGLGAPPPPRAMPLIGRSNDVLLAPRDRKTTSRSDQRTQAELMGLDGTLRVDQAAGDRVTTTLHGSARLHLEWRSADGAVELRLQDQSLLRFALAPDAWHSLDLWFDAGDATRPATLVTRTDDGEPIRSTLGPAVPAGPLVLCARQEATEFRNAWIAPLTPASRSTEVAADRTRWGRWTSLVDAFEPDASGSPWITRGGDASFASVGDTIVGSSAPKTPNTFLATRATYGDFELLVDVRQDPALNSGIQIRSEGAGEGSNRRSGIVGYQVELDPSPRAYTGGIYEEGGRGWLLPLTDAPYARDAYRPGEWNRIRILAEGPVIQTWVNGMPAATLVDAKRLEGCIALQVHSVGDRGGPTSDPLRVEWKNLRVRVKEMP